MFRSSTLLTLSSDIQSPAREGLPESVKLDVLLTQVQTHQESLLFPVRPNRTLQDAAKISLNVYITASNTTALRVRDYLSEVSMI